MTDTESLRAAYEHLRDEASSHSRPGCLAVAAKNGAKALASALERLDEHEASFRLYDDACRRGTKMWQQATGDTHTWPDTARLVAWLLARLEAAEGVVEAADDVQTTKEEGT